MPYKCSVPVKQGKKQGQTERIRSCLLPCMGSLWGVQACLWISLACRANISLTGAAAGVAHHAEP